MAIPVIKDSIERRAVGEVRADAAEFKLCGYAANFNVESKPMGGGDFVEVIQRGAFTRSLKKGDDVVCLFNHDANRVLGRRSAGTLDVKEDSKGLYFSCQLDENNSEHCDLYASVKRGDINQCSFAFSVAPNGQNWQETNATDGPLYRRVLTDVNLIDVSAVTYPAYPATQVDARDQKQASSVGWPAEIVNKVMAIRDRVFQDSLK